MRAVPGRLCIAVLLMNGMEWNGLLYNEWVCCAVQIEIYMSLIIMSACMSRVWVKGITSESNMRHSFDEE
jgi:hypothetical protein